SNLDFQPSKNDDIEESRLESLFTATVKEELKNRTGTSRKRTFLKLKENIATISGPTKTAKRHECAVCTKCFKYQSYLKRHELLSHLKSHLRSHSGKKPFKCNYCEKLFSQKGHCNEHARIHTGERPHQCNLCSSAFAQAGNLKRHMRTHNEERPYKTL
ncbi:unnamed protein product, partial [Cyprideis torosa]